MNRHNFFGSVLTIGAVALFGTTAHAAIVRSANINLSLPANSTGMSLNFITGASAASPTVTGNDLGLFYSSNWTAFGAGDGFVADLTTLAATLTNLQPGDTVGPSSIFKNSPAQTRNTFNDVAEAFIGVRFVDESDSSTHYGYAKVFLPTTTTNGAPGTLYWYAYESSPNTAITIAVPEPTTLGLLAGAAATVLRRRRA